MNTMSADKASEFLEGIITKAMDEVAPVKTKKVSVNKINQWQRKVLKLAPRISIIDKGKLSMGIC